MTDTAPAEARPIVGQFGLTGGLRKPASMNGRTRLIEQATARILEEPDEAIVVAVAAFQSSI